MSDAKSGGRPLRADAARNREHLLQVAKTAFTEVGPEVSLEEIARRAGVGIGTLYRHFPNRGAVIEAVYRREVQQLADAAGQLLAQTSPAEALRAWMRLFVDYLATKRVISPAFTAIEGGPSALYATSGEALRATLGQFLEQGIAAGQMRPEIEVADMMQALAGLSYNSDSPGWRERALRLIDVLIAGLRPES